MAKSPVFGSGRNWYHRPRRAAPNHPAAANVNMRGKKTKSMSCYCCVCLDMRDKMLRDIHAKEINNGVDN
jgi:hypothetical protein